MIELPLDSHTGSTDESTACMIRENREKVYRNQSNEAILVAHRIVLSDKEVALHVDPVARLVSRYPCEGINAGFESCKDSCYHGAATL